MNQGIMRHLMELLADSMECMSDKWESRAKNAPCGSLEAKACLEAAADFAKFEKSARRSVNNLEEAKGKTTNTER